MRNKARRLLMKQGRVHKGDRKDVDHRQPIVKGGRNTPTNLRVSSPGRNRSFRRTKMANMR